MRVPDNIVETLANGEYYKVDRVGTNEQAARMQAMEILGQWEHNMMPVLIALITKIQEQATSIAMFEYNQKWRKRRP